ncbi:DUF2760 domain-containing protein [Marinobacterium sedimentorum]|uniref:DUF2760 domain-containing protein n=1 Tax=Marinobacterium sedimentorum TaxID=2927804 RepID=UPI0020C5CEC0|nr:DUF2760 domain-containing protein [Marinobacterium sedimentorum]MCP8687359.1 DUF2760 domain-containing protein [Marinobacterium sedimentorum]
MNFNLTMMPTTLDAGHLGLAVLALILLLLWLAKGTGGATDSRTEQAAAPAVAPKAESAPRSEPQAQTKPVAQAAVQLKQITPDTALQLLSLLQQEARFVDFVREDLGSFSDADIGAAARVVHEGSQKALNSYFTLEPVRTEDEETRVTLAEGFNAQEVRLTGNVVGTAPFTGTLVHRGWKVTEVKLPKLASGHDTRVIAPAEVEL